MNGEGVLEPHAPNMPTYGAIYGSSKERTAALDGWLWHYNHRRRHSALGHQPPVTRTNVLGSYT
jgi:transposase InsO family protein